MPPNGTIKFFTIPHILETKYLKCNADGESMIPGQICSITLTTFVSIK